MENDYLNILAGIVLPAQILEYFSIVGIEQNSTEIHGKAKQVCPLWPKRINPFGHNMIAPHGPNNIDHLVHILPEIFLCRFESPSPGVMGY